MTMNGNIPVSMQQVWGWRVIWHLFLVSIAGGGYIGAFIHSLVYPQHSRLFMALALLAVVPLLIIGIVLLISHLGTKTKVIRAFCHPSSSWLSRGGITLLVFLVLDIVHGSLPMTAPPPTPWLPLVHLVMGIVTSLSALFVLLYSGMVLARLRSFPCWRSELLLLLFIVSGLSGGLMMLVLFLLLLGITPNLDVRQPLMLAMQHTGYVLVVQAIALGCYLWWAMALPAAREYARIITGGAYSITFWVGVVVVGILVPLGFGLYAAYAQIEGLLLIIFALELAVFGLVGVLLLRYMIVSAGVSSTLPVEGNPVTLPPNARAPTSHLVRYH